MNQGKRRRPQHVDDQLEGYVLGALTGDQQRIVKRHLIFCSRCRHRSDNLAGVAARLAFAPLLHQPPPDLKIRVLAAVQAADQPSRVLSFADGASRRRRNAPSWLLVAAAPWLLVAVLGLAWWATRTPAQRPSVLSTLTLSGPSGVLGVMTTDAKSSQGALVLTHLPSFSHNKTFVCWLKHGGQMERVCTFHLRNREDDAVVVLAFKRPWTNDSWLGVSAESSPSPSRPSGTFLATAQVR